MFLSQKAYSSDSRVADSFPVEKITAVTNCCKSGGLKQLRRTPCVSAGQQPKGKTSAGPCPPREGSRRPSVSLASAASGGVFSHVSASALPPSRPAAWRLQSPLPHLHVSVSSLSGTNIHVRRVPLATSGNTGRQQGLHWGICLPRQSLLASPRHSPRMIS